MSKIKSARYAAATLMFLCTTGTGAYQPGSGNHPAVINTSSSGLFSYSFSGFYNHWNLGD